MTDSIQVISWNILNPDPDFVKMSLRPVVNQSPGKINFSPPVYEQSRKLAVINEVYRISQKTISRQSYQELQIIMKSMYLQYGRNIPTNIEEQVITLNKYNIIDTIFDICLVESNLLDAIFL